ncbi:hypothetical protein EDD85DRAFT_789971 [Armillaria nabsnona]|nr:hypothetical protein EDD85DRAFT_789971 [Armillaria nabsnona]
MLSLPLVLLSLHALAVYSAPALDSDDVAILWRGGTKRGRSSRTSTMRPPEFYNEQSDSSSRSENLSSSPSSQYSDHTGSSQERQELQDDKDMEEYENQQTRGYHCDHLVELQTEHVILSQYCTTGTPERYRN